MATSFNSILQSLLNLPARASAAEWTDIENEINQLDGREVPGAGLRKLVNFLSLAISTLPKNYKRNKSAIGARLNLIGQVLDKHVIEDNSYASNKRDLRKVLRNHFLSDQFTDKEPKLADKMRQQATRGLLQYVGADKFDNRERMINRNANLRKTRDARHKDQLDISQEYIEDMVKAMVGNIEAGVKPHSILLLMELCTGARFGEVVMASKFSRAPDMPNKRKKSVKSGIKTPAVVQRVKQQGLLKKVVTVENTGPAEVIKPVLPYVDVDQLLEWLAEWREKYGITPAMQGTYDVATVARFRQAANKLIKEYMGGDYSTHILRAIYAVAAYDLFRPANMSENDFIRGTLGHDALDVSLSYNHVNIIANDDDSE